MSSTSGLGGDAVLLSWRNGIDPRTAQCGSTNEPPLCNLRTHSLFVVAEYGLDGEAVCIVSWDHSDFHFGPVLVEAGTFARTGCDDVLPRH